MEQIDYLKLKVVTLEYQNLLLRIDRTKVNAKIAYDNEIRKHGLDPEVNYILNDEACTVTPLPQPNPQSKDE